MDQANQGDSMNMRIIVSFLLLFSTVSIADVPLDKRHLLPDAALLRAEQTTFKVVIKNRVIGIGFAFDFQMTPNGYRSYVHQ